MKVALAIGALVVIVALVFVYREMNRSDDGTVTPRETGSSESSASGTPTPTPGSAAAHAGETPALADAEAGPRAKKGVGLWGMTDVLDIVPETYELTPASGMVAVNVNGGRSTTYPATPQFPGGERTTVKGKVVDRTGTAVEGATVLVSTQFDMSGDSFLAAGGATSDARGEFEIANIPATTGLRAMALHRRGWSMPAQVMANSVTVTIGAGSLKGSAKFEHRGTSFDLRLVNADDTLRMTWESRADGTFDVALLPPGAYKLHWSRVQASGTAAKSEIRDLVIEEGKQTVVELEQHEGTLVTTIPRLPEGLTLDSLGGFLFPGRTAPKDPKAAMARMRAENTPYHLVGGVDLQPRIQFQDVEHGDYTACLTDAKQTIWGCFSFEVHGKQIDVGIDVKKL